MPKNSKPRPEPHLADLIIEWMKSELPSVKTEEVKGTVRFHIMHGKGQWQSKLFDVDINARSMEISGIGQLVEYIEIRDDGVTFGKWGGGCEIEAADPNFFGKLAYMMSRCAQVVTMGGFTPNFPPEIAEAEDG